MKIEPEIKAIMNKIEEVSAKHGRWESFADWVSCTAISISNAVDGLHYDMREKEYLQIMKKYDDSERRKFVEMFGILQHLLEMHQREGSYKEILGFIYHEMNLNNENAGQFFTPWSICRMTGGLVFDQKTKEIAEKDGFISIVEPACGAGVTILGGVEAAARLGINPARILVKATDIDPKCVQMTYVQLSLYGIPAVVSHGNTITQEVWSNWYTPVYFLDSWYWLDETPNKRQCEEMELFRRAANPMYAAIRRMEEGRRENGEHEKTDTNP